jgi:hypothetical protein
MKVEATARLQAYVEAARRAKQLQEEQEAESWKPMEDEWGNPIYEDDASSPQKSTQPAKSARRLMLIRLFQQTPIYWGQS